MTVMSENFTEGCSELNQEAADRRGMVITRLLAGGSFAHLSAASAQGTLS
jgi:hypothetical protein